MRAGTPAVRYAVGTSVPPDALAALLDQTDWAHGRSQVQLAAMLRRSIASVSAHQGNRLVGFARAHGDGVFIATIDDVVVDGRWRGRGIGRGLVARLMEELDGIASVHLCCRPALGPFYAELGFEASLMMLMKRG